MGVGREGGVLGMPSRRGNGAAAAPWAAGDGSSARAVDSWLGAGKRG